MCASGDEERPETDAEDDILGEDSESRRHSVSIRLPCPLPDSSGERSLLHACARIKIEEVNDVE